MASERKGFEVETPSLDFGIQDTESLDSIDTDSFLFGSDPDEVTPISSNEKQTPPSPDKKESPSSPQPHKQVKTESAPVTVPELETDDFLDEESTDEKSEQDEEKKSEEKEDEGTQGSDEENVFQTYSEALLQMGIFNLDEGEQSIAINTPEEFKERWIHERRKDAYNMLDRELGRFGKKHQDFLVAVFNGVSPEDYFSVYSNIENISNLDITKEDHQKIIYREALKKQGLPAEKIEKKLQRAIELGELEDDAKDFHEVLLEQEQVRLDGLQAQKEKEIEQKQLEKQDYDNGIRTIIVNKLQEKEFDGIPLNEKMANEVFDFLTTEKWQLRDGELLTDFDKYFLELKNPANFEKRVKLAILAKSDFNLDGIKKVAISKETNELFSSLKKQNKSKQSATPAKKNSTTQTPRFNFNFSE